MKHFCESRRPVDRWKSAGFLALLFLSLAAAEHVFAQTPAVPAVLVVPAEVRSLAQQRDFVGRVEAVERVDLRARVSGFLGPRQFRDGDRIKAGQALFLIEPESYQALVDQRQAQLESAQAVLDNADLQLQRGRELGKTNAIAQAQIDQRQADQSKAAASVKEAQAALEDARIQLSYTTIKSPIDGRIGRAAVTPGNLVGPDTGVLATVVRDDDVHVLFSVSQREILDARRRGLGASSNDVKLKLADGQLYDQPGTLGFLDVTVDTKTDGQLVRATFPNPGQLLTDGQTVRVVLEEANQAQTVAIQQAAIAVDQTGPYVFVVSADNKVELRRIRMGTQRDGLVAIEDGIKAGDLVIVQGQQRAKPGQIVAPQRVPQ